MLVRSTKVYPQASKHGVLGLMRSLRLYLPQSVGVRVNVVCPWAVDTQMLSGIREVWRKEDLPLNQPDGVAAVIAGLTAAKGMNGKAMYVEGNRAWEFDEKIGELEPLWLGAEQSSTLNRGQAAMGEASATVRMFFL